MSSKLPYDKLRSWANTLRSLPETRMAVAQRAAPILSAQLVGSFDAGQTVYGGARPKGRRGPLRLVKTGALRGNLRFIPRGTRLQCSLGFSYARFLIKFGILPRGGAALPAAWEQAIKDVANAEVSARLGRAG